MKEIRYRVEQFDLMNKCWNLLETFEGPESLEQAKKYADFWGNLTIVSSSYDLGIIYVTKG